MKARAGCILLILLAVAGPADAQGKPEKERIRIGHAARVVSHSIPYLAAQAGLFREEGVQVEVVKQPLITLRKETRVLLSASPPSSSSLARYRNSTAAALSNACMPARSEIEAKGYAFLRLARDAGRQSERTGYD
jgi:hypothetical protein